MLTGKTVRAIATPALREYEQALRKGAGPEELQSLRSRSRGGLAEERVAVAGQVTGLVTSIATAADVIEELVRGSYEVYQRLGTTIRAGVSEAPAQARVAERP
jgi:NAD(P)H-dependent flavin oxidoreductase YrpB (nitropropane dioxygenase family)